jgi:hypothetical protein
MRSPHRTATMSERSWRKRYRTKVTSIAMRAIAKASVEIENLTGLMASPSNLL